ncbi:trypsin-like peptidase domain-containing protein [Pseudonocardia dioxanivorans]|jgi:putative serine protease PepD|uniref:Peptidase S1 and S6 chymotrypsin/Hap n=1 Tax=Pseudonocardia dioxanivorans (strain ATCC 55486 / DSM 44775 / JCM 13855 / CB1190) TaxID=675635 RepID=F4CWS6_PSEUX|nr:trypsin-like peptidase domain-containing protein [Pseudonocardia dioxanivorans]AEA23828.1 peptidase S1 and S6 chymotrypsin/Hap [Pseudonocardia dioxanivorans CB1190]
MTDEQRGYGRSDADADPAGRPPTEQTSVPPEGGRSTDDTPAAGFPRAAEGGRPTAADAAADTVADDGTHADAGIGADGGAAAAEHPTQHLGAPRYEPYAGAAAQAGSPWNRTGWNQPGSTPGPYGAHPSGNPGRPGPYGAPYGVGAQPPAGDPAGTPSGPGATATMAPPAPQPKARASRPMIGIVAAALVAGLVGGGAGFGAAYAVFDHGGGAVTLSSSPASTSNVAAVNGTVAAAAAKAMPSTVDIRVAMAQGEVEGSGVVLTSDGKILTNNHVVAEQGQITVTLSDGSQHQATVVGTAPSYDLAVLQLSGVSGLTPATLGQSKDVQVGQQVVAIGSPQGLTGTVTSGIVSALNRTVSTQGEDGSAVVYNGLQTDAPINQGNSGGALVNLDGQVVGINSAIQTAGNSTGSIGLGFAIPVDQAKRVAQEIINTGHATKPVLGVQGSTSGRPTDVSGAQIAAVQDGSPAAAAGLKAGDVVTKVGNTTVNDFSDLVAQIGSYAPGDKVTLTVGSGGSARTVDVTLGSQQDQGASTSTGGSDSGGGSGQENPFGNGQNPFGRNPFGNGGN